MVGEQTMVARTVARYSWVWTLSVLACAEAASLDLSGLSIQQSDKEKAPAVTVDTDDWVVFRLIDEDGRPVAGARVSRDVALDDPRNLQLLLHGGVGPQMGRSL